MHTNLIFQILAGILVGWLAGIVVQGLKEWVFLPDLDHWCPRGFFGRGSSSCFFIIQIEGFWGALGISVVGAVVLLIVLRIIKSD